MRFLADVGELQDTPYRNGDGVFAIDISGDTVLGAFLKDAYADKRLFVSVGNDSVNSHAINSQSCLRHESKGDKQKCEA